MTSIPELGHVDTDRLRTQILSYFMDAHEESVSGAELAAILGITRTAVWKHIRALEDLGFEFSAAPRRGYKLATVPNLVMEPILGRYLLDDSELGKTVFWFDSVTSTNMLANELAKLEEIPHGTVVTAVEQEGGRGRQRRVWNSPDGGLWLSIILKKPFALSRAAELTLMASVAIARAVEEVTTLKLDIKWPNDLLYGGKKVCGILAELRANGENVQHAVLGIGLNSNVTVEQIPLQLQSIATSIAIETGIEVPQAQMAAAILTNFEHLYQSLVVDGGGFRTVAQEWEQRCVTIGKQVRVQTPTSLVEGTATRVDGHGVLYVKSPQGEEMAIHSGDILF